MPTKTTTVETKATHDGLATVKEYCINQQHLPLVIEPKGSWESFSSLREYLHQNREVLRQKVLEHGGILLRNFPVSNAQEFAAVIEALNWGKAVNYIGGDSPRNKIIGAVYTSTEAPPSVKIPLHNELSFVKHYPRHIYFFCEKEPQQGGETIIGDARQILESVDPAVRERLEQKGIRYVSCYYGKNKIMEWLNRVQPSHKSWYQVFETENPKEVERLCRENDFEFSWKRDGWIQIAQRRPATMKHPETGEPVWFNQVHLYDFNPKLLGWGRYVGAKLFYWRKHTRLHEVFYGDGSRIPRKDIYHIMDVLDQKTIAFPWRKGDVMILDNVLAMHGRATFTRPRRILAALTG